jgi:hypothetical protein
MRLVCRCVLVCAVAVLCVITPGVACAQTAGEREILLQPAPPAPVGDRESPLELLGLRKPDLAGLRISAFVVGSFSYNSGLQMVPEFAGGRRPWPTPGRAIADSPGRTGSPRAGRVSQKAARRSG